MLRSSMERVYGHSFPPVNLASLLKLADARSYDLHVKSNYHTHSTFCDGKADAATMAKAAFDAGYDILGFSSHAPLPFETSWNLPEADTAAYCAEIRRLGSEWKPKGLEILLGLEIDWIEGQSSPADSRWDSLGLDFKLGSTHFVRPGSGEAFAVDEPDEAFFAHLSSEAGGDYRTVYRHYYRNLAGMIAAGGFDILGHFDLVRKNNRAGHFFDEDGREYLSAAMEAVELLAGRDFVVEVNTGGMARGKTRNPYPSLAIMKRLSEMKIRITFCDDAHAPVHLGKHWEDSKSLARAAGYRSIAVLSEGVWGERDIDEI